MDEVTAAQRVFKAYGDYLQTHHPVFTNLFLDGIPSSLLPMPRTDILDALHVLELHYRQTGNIKGTEAVDRAQCILRLYLEDDEALRIAAQVLLEPELRETIALNLKRLQDARLSLSASEQFESCGSRPVS